VTQALPFGGGFRRCKVKSRGRTAVCIEAVLGEFVMDIPDDVRKLRAVVEKAIRIDPC
jgi:hypothetical protein